MPESSGIQVLEEVVARTAQAEKARGDFVAFLKFVGRAKSGDKLRLDPEIIVTAGEVQRAFKMGVDFVNEQARGTLKSTIGCHFHAWIIGRNPNISIGHFSNRDEEAEDRNCWVQEIMRSEEYRMVFPAKKCQLVERGKNACNRSRTVVHGKVNKTVPNIQAKGIESVRAGPHYDRGWLDDVCDVKNSIVMPAKKDNIKQLYRTQIRKMIQDPRLGHGLGKEGYGRYYHSGTPYAEDDLWAEVVAQARSLPCTKPMSGHVYRRLACGGPPDFFSPVPNVITSETLAEEYGPNGEHARSYEMSYMLKALGEGERPFTKVWFWLYSKFAPSNRLVDAIGYLPLALEAAENRKETRTWPCVMAIDPGFTVGRGASYTGVVVGLLSPEGIVYIVYALGHRAPWDETRMRLVALVKRWQPDRVLIEEAAQQMVVQSFFRDQGINNVEGVRTGNRSKFIRAMDVSGDVNSGRVCLPGRVLPGDKIVPAALPIHGNIPMLHEHLVAFPAVAWCDDVDAFVYCVQALRQMAAPQQERAKEEVKTGWERRVQLVQEANFGKQRRPEIPAEWRVFSEVA